MIAITDCKALLLGLFLKTLTWNLIFKFFFFFKDGLCGKSNWFQAWQPKFDFSGSDVSFLWPPLLSCGMWQSTHRPSYTPIQKNIVWMCVVRRKLAEICSSLFYHVGSRDQTLVLKLGSKCLYLPTHLAGPDLKPWLQACFWGNISPLIRFFKKQMNSLLI